MLTQIDLDSDYTAALAYVAKANGMSRREYAADFIEKALDKVPGLMDMIRKQKVSGLKLEEDSMDIPEPEQERRPAFAAFEREYLYRFSYLDPQRGFIEGRGTTSGKALANAMGLPEGEHYDPKKYYEEFRAPQRID